MLVAARALLSWEGPFPSQLLPRLDTTQEARSTQDKLPPQGRCPGGWSVHFHYLSLCEPSRKPRGKHRCDLSLSTPKEEYGRQKEGAQQAALSHRELTLLQGP